MTDKQIIIDGVDVSGCPHIEYNHKWWDIAGREQNSENVCSLSFDNNAEFDEDFICGQNPNCYHKQLKRAEQRIVELNKTIEAKEQECEELKETLNEGCLHNLTLMTEQRVLLQTLTEIKEIAESEMDSKEFIAIQCMLNGSSDDKNKVLKQILQKISEVENVSSNSQ